jgi:hypothetical protein
MRRAAPLVLAAIALVGVLALAAVAAARDDRFVYSIGVGAFTPVAVLDRGVEACQHGIRVPDDSTFDEVDVPVGTFHRPGPALELTIRAQGGGRVLARGRLAGGYPDIGQRPTEAIATGPTRLAGPVDVCVRNAGGRRAAIYGGAAYASPPTTMTIAGKPAPSDMSVGFSLAHGRSLLAWVPDMLERATVFKSAVVGRGLLILLGLLVFAGVPLALALALRAAAREDDAP